MKFSLINKRNNRNNKVNFVHNINNKYVDSNQKSPPKQVHPIINNSAINVKNIRNMFSLLQSANRGGCGSCGGAR